MDGQARLHPTHFYKGIVYRYHVLGTNEEAGNFGFSGRRSEKFDDLRYSEDWAVEMGDRGVFGDEGVVTRGDARADGVKVRGVGVAREYNVGFVVDNAVAGVGSDVAEELGDVVIGEFGGRGVSGANLTERRKYFVVNGAGVV